MYQTHIFANGLRLIHNYVPNKAAYCGLIINVGSRDEREDELGMAHFIEHVIFKGTEKRKAYRAYVGIVCRHRVSFGVPGEGDREGERRGTG